MTNDNNKLTRTFKVGLPALQRRVAEAKVATQASADVLASMPNRLVLLLDVSGSMGCGETLPDKTDKTRIDLLKDAVVSFIASCNFVDTCVAIRTFPESLNVPFLLDASQLTFSIMGLQPQGGTPMGRALEQVIMNDSLTRCVVVSDGGATDNPISDDQIPKYVEASVVIDTVSIGRDSENSEALLQRLASATGGVYLKFEDVGNFAKNFKYLTPGFRAMLTSGSDVAEMIGATEVK